MTPLRIPPLTQMKIPRGIGIDPPAQMAPQMVHRPAPRPMPRPVDHAPIAPVVPQTVAAPAQPDATPASEPQPNKGWLIGAGALAAVLVAWLAWSWPDSSVAQTTELPQPTPAQTQPATVATPRTSVATPNTPRATQPQRQEPATPSPSPWDALFTTTMPNE